MRLSIIDSMKFIMIIGIVMVHSNVSFVNTDSPCCGWACSVVDFTSELARVSCVPLFFLISGFLFFRGIKRFDISVYKNKLSRRIGSLLIPYLFWNSMAMFLLCFKFYCLGWSGLGIFTDTGIDMIKWVEGFWTITENEDMPYAFAFWFIRNLMVFNILSPLAWLISRHRTAIICFYLLYLFSSLPFYGFEWYLLGSILSIRDIRLPLISKFHFKQIFLILLCVVLGILMRIIPEFYRIFHIILVIFALMIFEYWGNVIANYSDKKGVVRVLVSSTFFIYAFHQLCSTIVRSFWSDLLGLNTAIGVFSSYIFTVFTLVSVSVGIFVLLKKICPSLLSVVIGRRNGV